MIRIFLALLLALAASSVEARVHYGGGHIGPGHRLGSGALPLDGGGSFSTSVSGAYSFRKLKTNYAGFAVRLQRVDTTTQDIGFTARGDFDTAAATTFCTTACTVRTWYDQSGLSRHLDQPTAAGQLNFVFNCNGLLPCARALGVTGQSAFAANVTPATGVASLSAVSMLGTAGSGSCVWIAQNGTANNRLSTFAAPWYLSGAASIAASPVPAVNVWHTQQGVLNGASTVFNVDGVETTGSVAGTVTAGAPFIGVSGSLGTVCSFAEGIVWDNYVLTPAERTALTTNQRNYYILPPPFDFNFAAGSYTNAGACATAATCLTTTRASTGYAENTAGTYTSFATNAPRVTNKGLLVEESRTNTIANNSMTGAVAGTPGTTPNGWNVTGYGTLVRTIVGTGTENGIDYIDIRFNGTSSTTFFQFVLDATTAALTGQTWTESVFLKLVDGSWSNITSLQLIQQEYTSGGVFVKSNTGSIVVPTSADLGLQRYSYTVALSGGGTTAFNRSGLIIANPAGVAIDFTLRVGWPQLEQAAFASSPIRTVGAAVTRAADNITVTTPPAFGSSYTLYGQGVPPVPVAAVSNIIVQADNATANEQAAMYRTGAGISGFLTISGGVTTSSASLGAMTTGARNKIGLGVTAGAQAGSANGGVVVVTAGALPGAPTTLRLGVNHAFGNRWNGWIERIAIWPTTKLTDAELQAVTAP